MVELPTKEELEQLYQKRGKDALIWYAWRNALRVLPMLGGGPFSNEWLQEHTYCFFAVCRVSLLLSQGCYLPAGVDEAANVAGVENYVDTAKYADAAVYAASKAAYAAGVLNDSALIARYALDASIVADALADPALCIAARADYDILLQQGLTSEQWLTIPLWPESYFFANGGEPKAVVRLKQFLGQLQQLGLDFLAEDIQALWDGRGAEIDPKRLGNYGKDLSETITSDPVALRKAILGEEKIGEIHAVRCLLLGPGGAGKSSLADRLQGKPVEHVKKLTPGVDYLEHQSLNLQTSFAEFELPKDDLDLYLWDFGGQTIFHGLHSAFLHENCVYVLVVDSRHEQAPDEWLHQIRHLAGSQAKVLLVTNWYEQCETRQNEARLLREFPSLLSSDSFFYFSCLDTKSPQFHKFVVALVKASLDSQKMVLKETLGIQAALQHQYQDDVFLDEDTLDEVIKKSTGKNDIAGDMTDKLQQLGFLVRVDGDGEQFCLKPAWAVDHAYQLLYSPRLREEQGVLTLADLKQEFKDQAQVSKKYTGHLVSFLQERSLCRRLQNDTYFFPDAAPANEPAAASQILKNEQNLVIRFDLPYLPLGFHARLVHSLFVPGNDVCIESPKDIWRQGFILRKGETKAVLHYLLRKNVIELVLVGKLSDFSALLSTLLVNLKAVMTAGEGMRVNQIHPSVKMHDQLFSVHSAEGLVRVMEGISNYGQLFERVRKMAADKQETHNYYADVTHNKGGDNSNFATKSESFTQNAGQQTVEITADQRKQIAVLADALLNNAKDLNPNELVAVAEVKKALEAPEQDESKSLLGKVWNATTGLTGFASNAAQIHQWGTQNTGLIAAAWAAGATLLP